MKKRRASVFRRLAVVVAAAAGAAVFAANPAFASYDDSLYFSTSDYCGSVRFVDYGPGAAGGGNNDDYLEFHDFCSDGHGVRVNAMINGKQLGSKYNGKGYRSTMVWDPYGSRTVLAGDKIGVTICLVDGSSDTTLTKCHFEGWTSVDG